MIKADVFENYEICRIGSQQFHRLEITCMMTMMTMMMCFIYCANYVLINLLMWSGWWCLSAWWLLCVVVGWCLLLCHFLGGGRGLKNSRLNNGQPLSIDLA